MNFTILKEATQRQFDLLTKGELFYTDVDSDLLWNTYLDSFPEGTNEIYKERREYDCTCCRQFIRNCGNVVSIVDNKLISIWDINVGGNFQIVADAMSKFVKSSPIKSIYRNDTPNLGTDYNLQASDGEVIRWDHFYYKLPRKFVESGSIGTVVGDATTNKEVLERGVTELSEDALSVVLDLIGQNSIYRGEEHLTSVKEFLKVVKKYNKVPESARQNYLWAESVRLGHAGRFKNTVIGTLVADIAGEVGLEKAVAKYEAKVAPENYKRSSKLVTKGMIKKAQDKVEELGIEDSLYRRYAVAEDLTINNVLHANREAKKSMNVFDDLSSAVKDKKPNMDKVEEVSIKDFISNILPKAESLEVMVDNSHTNNFTSLIAPVNKDAKPILKWGNNFSWSYNGEVTDSMKERVKKAGGNVNGVLRFSIQWNDGEKSYSDLDAHCIEPDGNHIYYQNKGRKQISTAMLDVDIQDPGNEVAVENITWTDESKIQKGVHRFIVHNYSNNKGNSGFTAEIEFKGTLYSFVYDKPVKSNDKVLVAELNFLKDGSVKLSTQIPTTEATKEVWGISTNKWSKVSMVMNSPNHWDGEETGNKHWFFMLEGCANPDRARGFYNEFLSNELTEHRKVFEVLGNKLRVEESTDQLSGVGFSSTKSNAILCKVNGAFNRVIKIKF